MPDLFKRLNKNGEVIKQSFLCNNGNSSRLVQCTFLFKFSDDYRAVSGEKKKKKRKEKKEVVCFHLLWMS